MTGIFTFAIIKAIISDHNISKEDSWRIKRNTGSEQDARDTEEYLLKLGFDGDEGGGNDTTVYIYAYKKIGETTQK